MRIILPHLPGTFDVDVKFVPGTPASYGPNGGDPGDPDTLELELIVWEFSDHDALVWAGGSSGWPAGPLYQTLLDHVMREIERDPLPWYRTDDELFDYSEVR